MCEEESDARKCICEGLNYQSVPDADREIATAALQEFKSQKYVQSLSSLKKLLAKRPLDTKVFHNASVVEFYLSDCKKTDQLNKKLLEVCKQVHYDVNDTELSDDFDYTVVIYNQAILLFHLQQYYTAITMLDKVFQYVEPLEEVLSRNICFLLLECYLAVYQLKNAVSMIGYIEGTMYRTATKAANKGNQKDKDGQNDEASDATSEAVKRKLMLCKARCYAMMKTSKACKREIKNLISSGSNIQNIPAFYLKSQLEYQRGNYRKALKLLNSVTLPEDMSKHFKETGDFLPSIFYNNVGCIHFYMGKPNLGAFYTEKALEAYKEEMTSITDMSPREKMNCRPLYQINLTTRHRLLYNLGLQYFQAQKFKQAFDCLAEAIKSFETNPRLWLRLAECCIQLYKPNYIDDYTEYKGKPFVKSTIGSGPHCKIIMNSLSEKLSCEDGKPNVPGCPPPSMHFAMLCLKNALYLVGEYGYKSTQPDSDYLPKEDDDLDRDNYKPVQVLPANSVQYLDVVYLRNSIIIASAYVSLCLGDVVMTQEYVIMLGCQPSISLTHKWFSQMYSGEAYLIMDQITDAVTNFGMDRWHMKLTLDLTDTDVVPTENSLKLYFRFEPGTEVNMDGSRQVGNFPRWCPDHIKTKNFVTLYNLAVAYAVREEWSKALENLQQINPDGNLPPQAKALLMYIHCHQGSVEDTKTYVKKYWQPKKE